jgi:hypothetical protein
MTLLQNLNLDTLTPARLWLALDKQTRLLAARALYEDSSMRDQAHQAIATAIKFRVAGVRKLSVDKRIDYLARVAQPDEGLASSLLIALHLGDRREILGSFLDELGIPHEDGLNTSEEELGAVPGAKLEPAVTALRQRFDSDDVDLYLVSLLVLDPDVWSGLTEVLKTAATRALS